MEDNKLIFLISPPNSGSTLLQQMLMNSEKIVSFPESWLMLHPLFQFKTNENIKTLYRHDLAVNHSNIFLKESGLNTKDYYKYIGEFYIKIYNKRLNNSSKLILDKTPRYYLIIDELKLAFPNAKFIFLVRNPLNTFASTLKRYKNNLNDKLLYLKSDFIYSFQNIYQSYEPTNKNQFLIRYEDLCNNTDKTIIGLFNFLNIEYSNSILEYNFKKPQNIDKWGDKSGNLIKNTKAYSVSNEIDTKYLTTPFIYRSVIDYCNYLDDKMMRFFSYEKAGNLTILKKNKFNYFLSLVFKCNSFFNKILNSKI